MKKMKKIKRKDLPKRGNKGRGFELQGGRKEIKKEKSRKNKKIDFFADLSKQVT